MKARRRPFLSASVAADMMNMPIVRLYTATTDWRPVAGVELVLDVGEGDVHHGASR